MMTAAMAASSSAYSTAVAPPSSSQSCLKRRMILSADPSTVTTERAQPQRPGRARAPGSRSERNHTRLEQRRIGHMSAGGQRPLGEAGVDVQAVHDGSLDRVVVVLPLLPVPLHGLPREAGERLGPQLVLGE